MKKLLFVFIVLVFFAGCSRDTLPVAPVVKTPDSSEKQAAPLGNFTFDLTAPTDYYGCAIGESVTMRWEQPFPYCAGFQSYGVYVNGSKVGTKYSISSTNYSHSFSNFGNNFWYVKVSYGYDPPFSAEYSDNTRHICCEIEKKVYGPNPVYSRNGQQWYINTWSGSTFTKTWKVYNVNSQFVFSVNADRLSINDFPSNIASGAYFITCTATSSLGRTYTTDSFQLTITW